MNELSMPFKVAPEIKGNLFSDVKTDAANSTDNKSEKGFEGELAGILGLNLPVMVDDNKIKMLTEIEGNAALGMGIPTDSTFTDNLGTVDETLNAVLKWCSAANTDASPQIDSLNNNSMLLPSTALSGSVETLPDMGGINLGKLSENQPVPDLKSILSGALEQSEDTPVQTADMYSGMLKTVGDENLDLQKANSIDMKMNTGDSITNKITEPLLNYHIIHKDSGGSNASADDSTNTYFINSNTANIMHNRDVNLSQQDSGGTKTIIANESIVSQVSDKISVLVKDGFSKATINLEPPSMGHLKVDIIVKDNMVRASIVAEHAVVKEVLKANLSSLTDALTHQGFQVSELNIFMGNRGGGYRDGFGLTAENNREPYYMSSDEVKAEDRYYRVNSDNNGGIDIFI